MASSYIEDRTGPNGKRYRAVLSWRAGGKTKYFKGKWTRYWKKANRQRQDLHGEADDIRLGIKKPRERHSWQQLTDRWIASRRGHASKTKFEYDAPMVEATVAFWGTDLDLSSITKERCTELREWLRSRKYRPHKYLGKSLVDKTYSETTVKMRLQALKACLYFAKDELEWIDKNPMVGLKIPEGADSERVYSDAEFQQFLKEAEPDLVAPLILARYRGLRRGELLMLGEPGSKKMLWRDADGDLWIRLRKPTRFGIKNDRDIKIRRKGERDIHVPAEALPHMDVGTGDGPVLRGLTTYRLRGMWRRLRQTAGISGRWHDWKHTAITRTLEEGGQLTDVRKMTGNTLDSLKRYEHIGDRPSKERLKKLAPTQITTQDVPGRPPVGRSGGHSPTGSKPRGGGARTHSLLVPKHELRRGGAYCPTCGQSVLVGCIRPKSAYLESA